MMAMISSAYVIANVLSKIRRISVRSDALVLMSTRWRSPSAASSRSLASSGFTPARRYTLTLLMAVSSNRRSNVGRSITSTPRSLE